MLAHWNVTRDFRDSAPKIHISLNLSRPVSASSLSQGTIRMPCFYVSWYDAVGNRTTTYRSILTTTLRRPNIAMISAHPLTQRWNQWLVQRICQVSQRWLTNGRISLGPTLACRWLKLMPLAQRKNYATCGPTLPPPAKMTLDQPLMPDLSSKLVLSESVFTYRHGPGLNVMRVRDLYA